MMEIDGRHSIKNKNKIFKKHAGVRRMDVREKQLLINQYVYSYYIESISETILLWLHMFRCTNTPLQTK